MKVEIIKCLKDNYSYLLINEKNKNACVIDPSESKPIIDFVEKENINLKFILNTHHHYDHVGGNNDLKKKYGSNIVGFKYDKERIPGIDILVEDNKIWIEKDFEAKIPNYKTYEEFGRKVQIIRDNVKKNINNLKSNGKKLIGYGSPAKATTALNFFGISEEIDFIVEDNKLKQGKFVPGVKIPINSKKKVINKNNNMLVLAWNFFKDIKKNNKDISNNFINIKDLES